MKARTLSLVGLGAFVAAAPLSLSSFLLFFVPLCLPFSHSSLRERLQDRRKPRPRSSEKRQPVFHAVSPFCLPAASRFFSPLPLSHPLTRPRVREKRLAEHENLRAPRVTCDLSALNVANEERERKRFCKNVCNTYIQLLSIYERY